jgi:hypothetical protein
LLPELPAHWIWRADAVAAGPAVIVDMDGVLSDASTRQHLLEGPNRRWDAFFEACGDDQPIPEAVELLRLLDPSLTIILLTARPIRVQRQTLDWLRRHPVRWDLLIMRGDDDWSSSHLFKKVELHELRGAGFDPRLAIDDDPRNVEMYRKEGVPGLYLHSGYYE